MRFTSLVNFRVPPIESIFSEIHYSSLSTDKDNLENPQIRNKISTTLKKHHVGKMNPTTPKASF